MINEHNAQPDPIVVPEWMKWITDAPIEVAGYRVRMGAATLLVTLNEHDRWDIGISPRSAPVTGHAVPTTFSQSDLEEAMHKGLRIFFRWAEILELEQRLDTEIAKMMTLNTEDERARNREQLSVARDLLEQARNRQEDPDGRQKA